MTLIVDRYLDPIEPDEQVGEYVYEDIDLAGVSWNYRLFWNDRAERWQMDVWTTDLSKEIRGKRLVPNYPLFWAHTGRRPVGGYLMLVDTSDQSAGDACTYDGLGWRWKLCWLTDDGVTVASTRPWTITVP